jgi:MOSC domain-containing protein YiiM
MLPRNLWRLFERLRGRARTPPTLAAIYVSAAAGEAMHSLETAEALAGQGLRGDRYCAGTGHWHPVESCELTLISQQDLERAGRRLGVGLDRGQHRRNLVVAGLRTRDLAHRRFRIGSARFEYWKPRPPCGYLNQVTGENTARALGPHSGVCLRILESGRIRVGDRLIFENPGSD